MRPGITDKAIMDLHKYFRSLTQEVHALKDRVRNLSPHWPTDGESKESVIRTILRRHLPSNLRVGRGFILKEGASTTQIDVLIYDAAYPVVYQDGDLAFVTRDAVRGIIEVKTRVSIGALPAVLDKLASNVDFVNNDRRDNGSDLTLFAGVFAFDFEPAITKENANTILDHLSAAVRGDQRRMINHIALGRSAFVRFWPHSPYERNNIPAYQKWHFYELPDEVPGYFINNVVSALAPDSVRDNEAIWFPEEGKEMHKIAEKAVRTEEERRSAKDDWND